MVTLTVVCVLMSGMNLVPPTDWKVERIVQVPILYSSIHTPSGTPSGTTQEYTRVELSRRIKAGESAKLPEGCHGEAELKHVGNEQP